ncbi:hypothetical protein FOZ63_031402 [Perkinsus olseni]|uniref:MYND-type domain-containing protein n=1 Tax=Perkinsus olseni TaxID=32597 RepID=A0A7J6PSI5_PEROL|nr:hypothetical protein FOZ63_031402 [Perkinsus olseni]
MAGCTSLSEEVSESIDIYSTLPFTGEGKSGHALLTPLHAACQSGDVDAARLILSNIEERHSALTSPEIPSPLVLAVRSGCASLVDLLLSHHSPIGEPDGPGRVSWSEEALGKSVIAACMVGDSTVVRVLAGASTVNYEDPERPSMTPLTTAVFHGHDDTVRTLLDLSASVTGDHPEGWTALHMATHMNSVKVTDMLLQATSREDTCKIPGFMGSDAISHAHPTVLHVAIRRSNLDLVKLLLRHRADPNAPSPPQGLTPLMAACQNGSEGTDIVQLLLTIESVVEKINAPCQDAGSNYEGYTALHFAAETHASLPIVSALLAHGASPLARTATAPPGYGYLPLDLTYDSVWPSTGESPPADYTIHSDIQKELMRCGSCGATGSPTVCFRCHAQRYCSGSCQRQHWPHHKTVCRPALA